MIKYKLQVGGVPITSIQYKGEPIGHLHYKGTQYSYWENPPPEPEPEPPAPPTPPAIYRLTGDSVGMTKFTVVSAMYGTNYVDLQVGIKASGYNYFGFQRQLFNGQWWNESSGTPAAMEAVDGHYNMKNGEFTYSGTSSSPPYVGGEWQPRLRLDVRWTGRRGSPSLSFRLYHSSTGYYYTVYLLDYTATATFNVDGACVSAQDTSYVSERGSGHWTDAQRPTLTRSGASFRVRNGAWVRLVKVSG